MEKNQILRQIFQAVTRSKWLGIEYHNKDGNHTSFWIGIRDIDVKNRVLRAKVLLSGVALHALAGYFFLLYNSGHYERKADWRP